MSGLFSHSDGRLRSGVISVIALAAILLAAAGAMKIHKSVQKKLISVQHVFESYKEVQDSEKENDMESDSAAGEKEPGATRENQASPADQSPKVRDAVETKQKDAAASQTHAERTADMPEQLLEEALKDNDGKLETLKAQLPKDMKAKTDESAPNVPTVMQARGFSSFDGSTANAAVEMLTTMDSTDGEVAKSKGQDPQVNDEKHRIAVLETETSAEDRSTERDAATVDEEKYMALFNEWRKTGAGGEDLGSVPFRVQNLRKVYPLFQMKPVAVVENAAYYDLTDGGRIAGEALSEYSSTVFMVDDPWGKWGEVLQRSGISESDSLQVRYYMYDFIKSAINTRVACAFEWCKSQNLIASDTATVGVDVLGRAYIIEKDGGGRFGVFVPLYLDTQDGRRIAIDPACFSNASDVLLLRKKGLL